MALASLEVGQLGSDVLGTEVGLHLLIDLAFVDGEVPGNGAQLGDGEDVHVGAERRQRQGLFQHHPAIQAQVR